MNDSITPDTEYRLAQAASNLCMPEIDPDLRLRISLSTVFATALLTSVGTSLILVVTWQWSFALITMIWLWAGLFSLILYSGQAPRLFGFGEVSGAFEDSHHHLFEGSFTKLVKTLRFHPKQDN